MTADRYLRTGTAVPVIYPGTLAMLEKAMKDAAVVSIRVPGQHHVLSVRGQHLQVLQVYEDGRCTWVYRQHSDES